MNTATLHCMSSPFYTNYLSPGGIFPAFTNSIFPWWVWKFAASQISADTMPTMFPVWLTCDSSATIQLDKKRFGRPASCCISTTNTYLYQPCFWTSHVPLLNIDTLSRLYLPNCFFLPCHYRHTSMKYDNNIQPLTACSVFLALGPVHQQLVPDACRQCQQQWNNYQQLN